uniref:Uncharacterized protein n=1 Tax=Arundo donax TaxID=35708 RepID=A0A0A8YT96_ARUDO
MHQHKDNQPKIKDAQGSFRVETSRSNQLHS